MQFYKAAGAVLGFKEAYRVNLTEVFPEKWRPSAGVLSRAWVAYTSKVYNNGLKERGTDARRADARKGRRITQKK